jgi:peptide/nickel transport system substrate-binding protein
MARITQEVILFVVPRRSLVLAAALATLATAVLATAGVALAASSSPAASKDTLIVLSPHLAPALDPDGVAANDPGQWLIGRNVADKLVTYPTKNVGGILIPNYGVDQDHFTGQLVQSYTRAGTVFTFKLKQGVKGCSGNELTAEDVVYTFARGKSVSGASPVAWFLGNVASVLPLDPLISKDPKAKLLKGEVTAVDKYTVQVKQMNPNGLFPRVTEIFALEIFDSVEMKKHATAADPWSHKYNDNQGLPAFGAYCVSKWIKGSEIDLTLNPNYNWGPKPQYTKVILRQVPSNSSRIAALKAGSADIATDLSPIEYNSLSTASGVTVYGTYNNQTTWLHLNYKYAPWNLPNNKFLRQAVAYAIPYDAIISGVYQGEARRWYGHAPSSYYGYVPIKRYDTDIAKAKAALVKAGFPGGKGLEKYADGLHLVYPAERSAALEPFANQIRTSLQAIGINLTLDPIPLGQFQDRHLAKKDIPLAIVDFGAPFAPDTGYAQQLFYASVDKGGLTNSENYSNAKFDALVNRSKQTSGATRLAILKQAALIQMDELPTIPVVEFKSRMAVRKGLSGWMQTSDNTLVFSAFTSS